MHIVITGANGFIGSALVQRLVTSPQTAGFSQEIKKITVVDLSLGHTLDSPLLNKIEGSCADPAILAEVFDQPADIVFHLASVPSGLCESNPELGMEVNIQGVIRLLDMLKAQENIPRLVFASSIAIYGKPDVPEVNDYTIHKPTLTYGAQKVIGEVLVNDYSRREWIDGISIRIPGIVARPPEPNGAVSIFFSDLIRELSNGRSFTCPVSDQAQSWLLSITRCVDNLLHASTLTIPERKTWTMPATTVVIKDLVKAIALCSGNSNISDLITYERDPWVEFNFGSYPPLNLPGAEALGFKKDKNLLDLVQQAL